MLINQRLRQENQKLISQLEKSLEEGKSVTNELKKLTIGDKFERITRDILLIPLELDAELNLTLDYLRRAEKNMKFIPFFGRKKSGYKMVSESIGNYVERHNVTLEKAKKYISEIKSQLALEFENSN